MPALIEVRDPNQGAAYQILYELTSPAYCTTRERQAEISDEFERVIKWAKETNSHPKAYEWAAGAILSEIERRIKMQDMSTRVQVALTGFPRPPK